MHIARGITITTCLVTALFATPVSASTVEKAWKPPCSVVAKAAVSSALETAVTRASNKPGAVPSCAYYDASSDEPIVSIWLKAKPLGAAASSYSFDAKQAKRNDFNRNFQTVPNTGKKAFFYESDISDRIEVLVGKRIFFVDGPQLTLDHAEAIADLVVDNS